MTSEVKEPETVDVSSVSTPTSKHVKSKDADAILGFLQEFGTSVQDPTPAQERRLQWKNGAVVITLAFLTSLMLYMDKMVLGYSSLLNLWEDTGLDQTKYNNLNTIFYVGFIVAQFPSYILLQKLPIKLYLVGVLSVWTVLIFFQCLARDYAGLMALRFFLGFAEAVVLPIIETTIGMFLTPQEHAIAQPLFWISCQGVAIPSGFIAYGVLHIKSTVPLWKIYAVIIACLTFLVTLVFAVVYPDNPARAVFLSNEERVWTIRRVQRASKGAILQNTIKKHQIVETFKDPISWLFGLLAFSMMLSNNLAYQQNLLFLSLGVSNLGSTLVSVAGGAFGSVLCLVAGLAQYKFKGQSAIIGSIFCVPAIVGGIGMVSLDWNNKVGLLAMILLAGNTVGIANITTLGWTVSSASGYTKRIYRNLFFFSGYCLGNLVSPQIWVKTDAPRYYSAWIVQIVLSWLLTLTLLLIVRYILAKRNVQRKANVAALQGKEPMGLVDRVDPDTGLAYTEQVEIGYLDLTDLENKYFIYPL